MPDSPRIILDLDLPVSYESDDALKRIVANRLGMGADELRSVQLLRRSLDARRRRFRYRARVEVELADAACRERALQRPGAGPLPGAPQVPDQRIVEGLQRGNRSLGAPPLIVGSGPAGLFAAWLLSEYGFQPIVLERGNRVEQRVRDVRRFEQSGEFDPESNILFGEGGAGTFSDGKLTCRTKSPVKRALFQLMVDCKAPEDILYQAKAHIGTDRLRAVLVHLRRLLEARGVQFRFATRMDDLILDEAGAIRGLRLQDGEELLSEVVLLGIGHSARDSYAMLQDRGVEMAFKPFQLGLRIEHPQPFVDGFRYGAEALGLQLPTAEYSVKAKALGTELFSFCMCPGGTIVPSVSQPGFLSTNGMSRRNRDSGWANSGLVYTVDLKETDGIDALAGVRLQERLEARAFEMGVGYQVPTQRASDFLAQRLSKGLVETTYPLGHVMADLREFLPGIGASLMGEALKTFQRRFPGFAGNDAVLVGPETRGSAPLRMPRELDSRESVSTPGLYPIGEGAGFAGGIVSAALDGVRSARVIVEAFAPAGSNPGK